MKKKNNQKIDLVALQILVDGIKTFANDKFSVNERVRALELLEKIYQDLFKGKNLYEKS